MRVVLPPGLLTWTIAGACLLLSSLVLISVTGGGDAQAFNGILLAFSIWAAAGVEALMRFDFVWRAPFKRFAFAVAAGLPLLLVFTAVSGLWMTQQGFATAHGALAVSAVRSESPTEASGSPAIHARLRAFVRPR